MSNNCCCEALVTLLAILSSTAAILELILEVAKLTKLLPTKLTVIAVGDIT